MMAFTFLVAGAFFGFGFVVGGYAAMWLWSRTYTGGGPPNPRPTPVSRHGRGRPGSSMRAGQSVRPEKPTEKPNVPPPPGPISGHTDYEDYRTAMCLAHGDPTNGVHAQAQAKGVLLCTCSVKS